MIIRIFDLIISILLIFIFLPVFIVLIFLIRKKINKKIFFIQPRTGLNGKLFKLIKFRTMSDETDAHGNLLPDNQRLNDFGKKLREYSLDEIPELLNVIKGEMSLVGPRPLLKEYLHLYSKEQKRRHTVKPGITGLAQINGRNGISWDQKFAYDCWYVDNQSLLLNIKILYKTIFKVISKENISFSDSITMEPFKGNKNG